MLFCQQMTKTPNLSAIRSHQFFLFFLQTRALPTSSSAELVMSCLCAAWVERGGLMGHTVSFLAISPPFIDWFVCINGGHVVRCRDVSARGTEPRAHTVVFWCSSTLLELICFGSHSYSFDGLLAVCFSSPGVYVSACARLKYLVTSHFSFFTPKHKASFYI